MFKNRSFYLVRRCLAALQFTILTLPLAVSAAQVTLQWDANDPSPAGYRLYQRTSGQSYDYNSPVWSGTLTTATLNGLIEGTTYYYVVRAYSGSDESGDSNEVQFTPVAINMDSDGDGIDDASDAFPNDPSEWLDLDADGIGDNADTDDDGDGMPDVWEVLYGLNPLSDDAGHDLDNDGVSNMEEYLADSDPSQAPANLSPEKPRHLAPYDAEVSVGLTPILATEPFADPDDDGHARSCYQISTFEDDFTTLVYEKTSSVHLTQLDLPDLVLDPDTTYLWRVRFYDSRNGMSEWSDPTSFTTVAYGETGDENGNGILDVQEIDGYLDLDQDGNNDAQQDGMLAVQSNDAFNPYIAIKRVDANTQLISIEAISGEGLSLASNHNQPEFLTGIINFKLYLLNGATETSVVVYFSQPAPSNARWYKYDPDQGWSIYSDVEFSSDRRSLTLHLEDGGIGDTDGVQNGVIVDPAGLGYSTQVSDDASGSTSSGSGGGGGCFISTTITAESGPSGWDAIALLLLISGLAAVGGFFFAHHGRRSEASRQKPGSEEGTIR